jgi:hypothetical protein
MKHILKPICHAENTDPYKGDEGKIPNSECPILGENIFQSNLK